jgi:hypothetical protein
LVLPSLPADGEPHEGHISEASERYPDSAKESNLIASDIPTEEAKEETRAPDYDPQPIVISPAYVTKRLTQENHRGGESLLLLLPLSHWRLTLSLLRIAEIPSDDDLVSEDAQSDGGENEASKQRTSQTKGGKEKKVLCLLVHQTLHMEELCSCLRVKGEERTFVVNHRC